MTQSTKFKSLKQTALSALLQLFRKANHLTQTLQRVAVELVVKYHLEIIFGSIAASYLFGLAFTLFEFDAEVRRKLHPFYDGITFQGGTKWNGYVTVANFVYGLMEMFSKLMLMIAGGTAIYFGVRTMIFIPCAIIELLDMVDYWLVRNGAWFTMDRFIIFNNWEFEFNYIKIGLILTFCYTEWKRLRYTGSLV